MKANINLPTGLYELSRIQSRQIGNVNGYQNDVSSLQPFIDLGTIPRHMTKFHRHRRVAQLILNGGDPVPIDVAAMKTLGELAQYAGKLTALAQGLEAGRNDRNLP